MEQTVLTADQKKVIEFVGKSEIAPLFYLTGGTALAGFYLNHRFSDDLDFFTDKKDFPTFQVEAIAEEIRKLIGADDFQYSKVYDRRIFFFNKNSEEFKVEFSYYPFQRLNPSNKINNFNIDSLEDIGANKIMALVDRIDAKDFVDIYFLLKENKFSLKELLKLTNKKFHFNFDPMTLGSEFAKIKAVTEMPRMVKPLALEELKSFFADLAKKLEPKIFDN